MNHFQTIGEYRSYTGCRFCESKRIVPVIDLGLMPLAGGFLKNKNEFEKEKLYPLELLFCKDCFLLQTKQVIQSDILFKNYFYFSSSIHTLVEHFRKLAKELGQAYASKGKKIVVEIGCNDGSFLKACENNGFVPIGVDPATNVVMPLIKNGMNIFNEYFNQHSATKIIKNFGKADIIFSSNTLAHIEDMHEVLRGIKKVLQPQGLFIFEVHYLAKLLKDLHYDMIYHEHQYYYSVLTLQQFLDQFDMEICDVKDIPIHGGSIQVWAQHKSEGTHKISPSVKRFIRQEQKLGLDKVQTFKKFYKEIDTTRKSLLRLLTRLRKQQKTIAGYGASGRATIITNFCGIDSRLLDYIMDDSPARQNIYMPGVHIQTYSSSILESKQPPAYTLLFAWAFIDEIKKRHRKYEKRGGRFIVPLPTVKIV